jgi:hypothetical protein
MNSPPGSMEYNPFTFLTLSDTTRIVKCWANQLIRI